MVQNLAPLGIITKNISRLSTVVQNSLILRHLLFYFPKSTRVSEQTNEHRGAWKGWEQGSVSEWGSSANEWVSVARKWVSGASEQVNGQASGPALTSGFFVVLNQRASSQKILPAKVRKSVPADNRCVLQNWKAVEPRNSTPATAAS